MGAAVRTARRLLLGTETDEKAWRILTSAALPAVDSRQFIRYIQNRTFKDGG